VGGVWGIRKGELDKMGRRKGERRVGEERRGGEERGKEGKELLSKVGAMGPASAKGPALAKDGRACIGCIAYICRSGQLIKEPTRR